MMRAVRKRARALILKECANCVDGGFCALADRPCMQISELRKIDGDELKLCTWFRNGVLPRDPALQAELTGKDAGGNIRLCAGCGQPILAGCNRQRFCAPCGERNRRTIHARTMRMSRSGGNKSANVTL